MKKTVNVSVVQMDIKGLDAEANLAHMCELVERVVTENCVDLIVFPELSNSGYVKAGDTAFNKEYARCAEKIPGPITRRLGDMAGRYGVHIVAGLLEAHPQVPYTLYDTAVLIGPAGNIIGKHHKMYFPEPERNYFYPGSSLEVFGTELGNIGLQVCKDASFPELSRIQTLKGAEIVCAIYNMPTTPGMDYLDERIRHVAVCRAIENVNYFIGCNRVGSDASGSFIGHSCVAGPMGQTLAYSASDQEEILRATLEDEVLLEARARFTYFRDRRPDMYALIAESL